MFYVADAKQTDSLSILYLQYDFHREIRFLPKTGNIRERLEEDECSVLKQNVVLVFCRVDFEIQFT